MADLEDGESIEVQGSGSNKYTLRNVGEAYSCTCPAWRNQSMPLERRTCKHLKAFRGEAVELARVGLAAGASAPAKATSSSSKAKADQDGPPILLANPWDNDQDLTGWWMSEKLDGVRAYWDGKAFLSRLGNRYYAPDWFTKNLPDFPLDGELWGGRKKFQRTVSIVRRQDQSDLWKEIAFLVFDAPARDEPFEDRLELCRRALDERRPDYAKFHEHQACKGLGHLREELARVEALGGEGLMLRKPGSRYEVGRSSTLLKVKSFFDAEALVVDHLPGTGKHEGRLGALLTELADGTRFSIGTGFSDKERKSPPKLGSVVTFRYQELSDGGVPRFPSYVGVRDDVKWPPDNALKGKSAVITGATPASAPKTPNVEEKMAPAKAKPSTPKDDKPEAPQAQAVENAKAPAPPSASRDIRRLEKSEGAIKVFWEIRITGSRHTVHTGRSWTSGTSQTRDFASPDEAARDAEKLLKEQLREGFVEVGAI
ncbi:MAG: DNA ligase [Polyangiaceae bacterium]|nr:DNA ligase [Polyangiaceae bacterium]NUQ72668.1 DNA ligase [Polyangiaceae bacterium]